ncbi:MAG: MOFRL family protein [Sulfurospirillum sp.]
MLQKAKEILEKQIKTTIIDKPVKDEVDIETQRLLAFTKANSGERACFIFGAECTVKANKNGIGGRNQHLGLNFLDKFRSKATLLFAATDGVDGNSDAAGVVIETNSKSKDNSDAIRAYLRDFNSNLYFQKNKSLVVTGPTHNNLLDIIMMIL